MTLAFIPGKAMGYVNNVLTVKLIPHRHYILFTLHSLLFGIVFTSEQERAREKEKRYRDADECFRRNGFDWL